MKRAKSVISYFDGVVTDGERRVRIIGFDKQTQEKLSQFQMKKEVVKLDNCSIKNSRSDDPQIFVSKTTSIKQSPRKFEVPHLDNIEDGTKVTVIATVVSLAPVRAVSTGIVQDVAISDSSGTSSLSAWEDNVDRLVTGQTYKF